MNRPGRSTTPISLIRYELHIVLTSFDEGVEIRFAAPGPSATLKHRLCQYWPDPCSNVLMADEAAVSLSFTEADVQSHAFVSSFRTPEIASSQATGPL